MPEDYRKILEPNTSTIYERLSAVRLFLESGYEVHLNFSPVIVYDDWLGQYSALFQIINSGAKHHSWDTDDVKAEIIFLTHNKDKHEYNLQNKIPGEEILWKPEIQEPKISQYGGSNIRYRSGNKMEYIKQFTELHDAIIPWNTIRYIF